MSELLINQPAYKTLLLGNEGFVRGSLEANLAYASCYPGTPSSEVPNTLFSGLPMLEPSNAQEMKDMAAYDFELLEQLQLLVIVRSTTRVAHSRGAVNANMKCFDLGQQAAQQASGRVREK